MDEARFLQIHTLTPYAATLLNRDDLGRAKRLPFGGAVRTRVSSQSLKRHWRTSLGEWSLADLPGALAVRSRRIFSDRIAPALRESGLDDEAIVPAVGAVRDVVLGVNVKKRDARATRKQQDGGADPFEELRTEQVIVLGRAEVDFLTDCCRELAADIRAANEAKGDTKKVTQAITDYIRRNRDNLGALNRAAGIDAAMFGRMVTSDLLARGDSAVHVAHSFTVNREEAEPDYFTAVDDLTAEEGELGSGHINSTELTSGLFYGYVVVDLPKLVENCSDDRNLAGMAVERLVNLIASVSPGAKLGSTAPYACAELMMVEAGHRQPRTLANAFLKPVAPHPDLKANAVTAMGDHLARFDGMYGIGEERAVASMLDLPDGLGTPRPLAEVAAWAGARARGAATGVPA